MVQNGAFHPGSGGGIGETTPERVLIASAPRHPEHEGKTVADLINLWDLPLDGTLTRLLDDEDRPVSW